MLSLQNLSVRYGDKILFENVSLELTVGCRYGIIGANGSGKSTLLKLIAGDEPLSDGRVSYPKSAKLGLLRQDHYRYEKNRVIDVVLQGNPNLWQALQGKEALLNQVDWTDEHVHQLTDFEEVIHAENGYEAEAIASRLLIGLGVKDLYHQGPLSALSGGYKLRVLLAQVLFKNPDILLLDEPTNHLDIISIKWLGEFLRQEYKGLLLFVSHDRDFLDTVATHILDVDYYTIIKYTGNYSQALQAKAQSAEMDEKTRENQEKKVAQLQTFVDKFGAKASKAKQAQSKAKQIEKIELTEIKQTTRIAPNLAFKIVRPSGKEVLRIEHLNKSFNGNQVLHNVTFNIQRGEKIALIGPNGVGKSTFLKILLGQIPADDGNYTWGYETHTAYFAQDHHEMLKDPCDLLTWLSDHATKRSSTEVRSMLGRVLFSGDDVKKSVKSLSGGEAARLLLANIMCQDHNVLILDEPTNHLDLEAIDALADALKAYQGTYIVVSHDRYFVNRIANRVIALTQEGVRDYHGDYQAYLDFYGEDYLAANQQTASKNIKQTKVKQPKVVKSDAKLKKEIDQLQNEIEQLEAALQAIHTKMAEPEFYSSIDQAEQQKWQQEAQALSQEISQKINKWEGLIKELE